MPRPTPHPDPQSSPHTPTTTSPRPHTPTPAGQVVRGLDVVDAINALSKGKKDNTATQADGAQIVDSGQLRKGTIVPDLALGL